ncbi:MAG: DUF2079 domain-containing protein [Clostridia bacterium]|nr:DUF2079 domain-containing protein [Clostridia bacterium]
MLSKNEVFARLRGSFTFERTACRVFAAWVCFALTVLCMLTGFDKIEFAQATGVWSVVGFFALYFALMTVLSFLLPRFHTDSWVLFLAASGCVCIWLMSETGSLQRLSFALAVTVAYALILVYCLRANAALLDKWRVGGKTVTVVAIVAGLATCTVMALYGCLRYKTFSAPNFDFGLFCNMFHNMAESGLPMATSERDMLLSHFAVHISPVYYLLLPFYWIFRSPMVLQIGQAVVLALGVVPIVLLARHFKLSGKTTVLLTLLYAFYPAVTSGTFYDLHENCFLTLFLLCTFLFYEKRKYIPMYLFALLTLSVKEDAAVYILVFALFLLISERNWKHGCVLAALSVGYFVLCGYLLEAGGQGMMTGRFDNLIYNEEDGLLGAVKTVLLNPGYFLSQVFTTSDWSYDKLVYLLQLLLPLGVLPFCTKRASRWLLLTPVLINLATNYVYQYDVGFQYHFGITAFLFYAAIKNLPALEAPTRKTLLAIGAAACACLYLASVSPRVSNQIEIWSKNHARYEKMEEFLDTLPADASVAASTFLLPHIADRDVIYEVYYHGGKADVDLVVLDARYTDHEKFKAQYLAEGYTLHSELEGSILVLQKP